MENQGPTILVASIVVMLATVFQHGVPALISWMKARKEIEQDDEAHKQEMIVRLRLSDEYERVIVRLDKRLDDVTLEVKELTEDRERLQQALADMQVKERLSEAENARLRLQVQELQQKVDSLTQALYLKGLQ